MTQHPLPTPMGPVTLAGDARLHDRQRAPKPGPGSRGMALRLGAVCLAWPLLLAPVGACAQGAGAPAAPPRTPPAAAGQVVVAGMVPDDVSRQALLGRVRELYGPERVVDQLGINPQQVAPPNWTAQVQKLLQADLKQVHRGQITIQGNVIEIKGEVDSDAIRQQLVTQLSSRLQNPTYTIRNGLRVSAAGQEAVDAALANRTIEFEPGSATLTAAGVAVLDQLVPILQQLGGRRFEVIGHTDALGARAANVALSSARAEVVRAYLVRKGLPDAMFSSSGVGPDRPLADNSTAEGRARNRRIEVRVSQ